MPPVPRYFTDAVFFLFASEADAKAGEGAIGTGFFIAYPATGLPDRKFLYAITAKHVVEDYDSCFLRVNVKGGGIDYGKVELADWAMSDHDDIAVCRLTLDWKDHRFYGINVDFLITQEKITAQMIGPGDDLYMIGMFSEFSGGESENVPVVRFGHLAMFPERPIEMDDGTTQEAYLGDLRSQGGFSGAPVFLYGSPDRLKFTDDGPTPTGVHIMCLAGLDVGHYPLHDPIVTLEETDGLKGTVGHVEGNTGMSIIVPGDRIRKLLDSGEVKEERERMSEEERRRNGPQKGRKDSN